MSVMKLSFTKPRAGAHTEVKIESAARISASVDGLEIVSFDCPDPRCHQLISLDSAAQGMTFELAIRDQSVLETLHACCRGEGRSKKLGASQLVIEKEVLAAIVQAIGTVTGALIVGVAGGLIGRHFARERDRQDKESQWRSHSIELTKLDWNAC